MKFSYKRTMFIGFAFMSICAFWQLYDSAIPKMLESTFGIKEGPVGIIMALDNLLALFMLPLFGALSDKTHTRFGRRMPYIMLGSFAALAFMVFIPIANNMSNLPLFVIMLLGVLLSMATYRSPAVALMPDLTPKPFRSKANAIINLMGTLGGVFTLIMISLLKPSVSGTYCPVFFTVAAMMFVSVIVLFIVIKENKIASQVAVYDPNETKAEVKAEKQPMAPEVKRSLTFLLLSVFLWFFAYNAVTTAFSRFTANVWGDTTDAYSNYLMAGTVAATLAYFPIGLLSAKVGRKKMILFGVALMTDAFILGLFIKEVSFLAYVVFALVGIGWASINVNSYPMVVEMSSGSDVGKYTGLYYTFSMAAQIATPVISGWMIQLMPAGYRILFPYAVGFLALAFVTMLFVKHGDTTEAAAKVSE